jgi:hypothetical protein
VPRGVAPQFWFQNAAIDGPGQNPAHPGNIAFNNKARTLFVTNHAGLTGLPDPSFLFAIFDVYVKDKAEKLFKDDDDD